MPGQSSGSAVGAPVPEILRHRPLLLPGWLDLRGRPTLPFPAGDPGHHPRLGASGQQSHPLPLGVPNGLEPLQLAVERRQELVLLQRVERHRRLLPYVRPQRVCIPFRAAQELCAVGSLGPHAGLTPRAQDLFQDLLHGAHEYRLALVL